MIVFGSCTKGTEPDCNNGLMDGTETGIDCGGACTPCDIQYPEFGTYGLNLLYGIDTLFVPGTGNSFKAVIPDGSTLKIEMNLINGAPWGYSLGSHVGWSISSYANGAQTFDAINGGTTELKIVKLIDTVSGTISIKYFENSTSITKQKILVWR
jgi:hypothetical protein